MTEEEKQKKEFFDDLTACFMRATDLDKQACLNLVTGLSTDHVDNMPEDMERWLQWCDNAQSRWMIVDSVAKGIITVNFDEKGELIVSLKDVERARRIAEGEEKL